MNESIRLNAGYNLYDAQLAVAESLQRCLTKSKVGLCIAECGTGKTKIGLAALSAYQRGQRTGKRFNVVLCPAHLIKKWIREIEETVPDAFAVTVTGIRTLNKICKLYERDTKTCFAILSKEKARDSYMKQPAVVWNRRRKAFICPDCYSPVEMELIDDGSKYRVPADQFFFKRGNKQNHRCDNCGSLLWTALTSERQSEWAKVSNLGFVHRELAHQYLASLEKKPVLHDAVQVIADNPDGVYYSDFY